MIKRITIENYMAHKLTTLELAQGVTVITGPNNAGKSAIVEAVRSIAQNPPYRHAIRHGAKNALIRLELDSGEIIEWSRTEKAAIYRVLTPGPEPGAYVTETYAKFGRTPPQDVQDLLRLDSVETETGSVDIHIGNQRQPIFLIDQAGSQAASFFAASTEAVYLLKMQQALKTRTDRAKSSRKEALSQCAKAEKLLKCYEVLDSIDPALHRAEKIYEGIQGNERALPFMADLVHLLADTGAKHLLKAQSATVLNELSQPSELLQTLPMEALAREMEHLFESLGLTRAEGEVLARLQQPPPLLHEVRRIEDLASFIAAAEQGYEAAIRKSRVLQEILSSPELKEVTSLEVLISGIERTILKARSADTATAILFQLTAPPALADALALEALASSLSRTESFLHEKLSRASALSGIRPASPLNEVRELQALVDSLDVRLKDRFAASVRSGALQEILPPPETKDLQSFEHLIAELETGGFKAGLCEGRCEILVQLRTYPLLKDVQDLQGLIGSMASTRSRLDRIDASMASLTGIQSLPVPAPLEELGVTADRISALQEALKQMEQLERDREEALLGKRREIERTIEKAGVCPFCGHPMDLAHFLEGMHAK